MLLRLLVALPVCLFLGTALANEPEPLVVAGDRAWPPFTFLDEEGRPRGLLIDLWQAVGQELGRPVEFRTADWNDTLNLVREGEAHLHSGLFQSPAREPYLDFSDELLPLSTRLFVSSRLRAQSFEDLGKIQVGITRGGFEVEFMREHHPAINLREYDNNEKLVQAALQGEVTAFVADYPVGMYFLHKFGTPEQYRVVETLYTKDLKSAVAEGNRELLREINQGLRTLSTEEMNRIVQKWVRSERVTPDWFLPVTVSALGLMVLAGVFSYTVLLRRQVMLRTGELSREIEDRKAVERSLRESEESYRNLFHAIQDSIYIHDLDGQFVDVNKAVEDMYGQPRSYFIGRTVHDLAAPGRNDLDTVRRAWNAALQGESQRFEFWGLRADGEAFPKEVVVNPGQYRGRPVVIAVARDITELKRTQIQLEEMAFLDPLTRLPNRRMLADRMRQSMAVADRKGSKLAVCYIDLDNFKPINDAHGHETGDQVLVTIAERLQATVRAADTAARLGGDEFVVLVNDIDQPGVGTVPMDRLLAALAEPVEVEGREYRLSASIGVTFYPDDHQDADTLLRHADQAMYAAKQQGRNRYHFFDPKHDREVHRFHEQRTRIRQAIRGGELRLYYQPKVNMRLGEVIGVEALVRWQHPDRGLLPPVEFLPLIEGHELIGELDAWVLGEAIAQLDRWRAEGVDLSVSANVSALFLQRSDFIDTLEGLLARHPELDPGRLSLEILETAALDDLELVSRVITRCAEKGIGFALDDFGTGYSSLTYFRNLPAQMLKIDRSFVRDMIEDSDDLGIVEGVIRLAQVFRRDVIAEGVETAAHGAVLLGLGCELGQGYGIARPMPAADIPGWMAAYRPPTLWRTGDALRWHPEDATLLGIEAIYREWAESVTHAVHSPEGEYARMPETGPPLDDWYREAGRARYGHYEPFRIMQALHHELGLIGAGLLKGRSEGTAGPASGPEDLAARLKALLEQLYQLQLLTARVNPERAAG